MLASHPLARIFSSDGEILQAARCKDDEKAFCKNMRSITIALIASSLKFRIITGRTGPTGWFQHREPLKVSLPHPDDDAFNMAAGVSHANPQMGHVKYSTREPQPVIAMAEQTEEVDKLRCDATMSSSDEDKTEDQKYIAATAYCYSKWYRWPSTRPSPQDGEEEEGRQEGGQEGEAAQEGRECGGVESI